MEEQTPTTADPRAVLIMLDDRCASPCYCFGPDGHAPRLMSTDVLDAVLEWLPTLDPSPPSVLYMVNDPRILDEGVRKVLKEASRSVICPPMHRTEQEAAGLPWSNTQVVVFPSLTAFEEANGIVEGRSGIIHVGRDEISRMSDVVLHKSAEMREQSVLRFRARDLNLWNGPDCAAYTEQIVKLAGHGLRLDATGVQTAWELWPTVKCSARRTLITIGPDGLCYPCPAFYHAGQTAGLGSRDNLTGNEVFLQTPDAACRVCQSPTCEACLFWESGMVTGEVSPCRLRTGMDKVKGASVHTSDRSGYLFENLLSDRAEVILSTYNPEGVGSGSMWAAEQVDDMPREEFVLALRSIHQMTEALIEGARETEKEVLSRYDEIVASLPRTRRDVFSYEQLAKAVEEMRREASVTAEQALESTESRRSLCMKLTRSILLTLAALREEIETRQWVPRPSSAESLQGIRERWESEELPLSEDQVAAIQQLYESLLGWTCVYTDAEDAQQCGFAVEHVAKHARERMDEARKAVGVWLCRTREQNGWRTRAGHLFNVDFEHGLKVSGARYIPGTTSVPEPEEWSPLLPLGGLEKEVYGRLRSLLDTSLATVKQRLNGYQEDAKDAERDLGGEIRILGQNVLDLRRWFCGMAEEHSWPQALEWRVNYETDWIEGRLVPRTRIS